MKNRTENHIDALRVRGFKGFADTELRELGAFNLLLGANDSGKTSMLEAVFLLSGTGAPGMLARIQDERDFPAGSAEDLFCLFYGLDTESPIEISAETGGSVGSRSLSVSVRKNTGPQRKISAGNGKTDTSGPTSSSSLSSPTVLRCEAGIFRSDRKKAPLLCEGELAFSPEGKAEISGGPDRAAVIPARFFRPGAACGTRLAADIAASGKEDELLEILRRVNPRIGKIEARGDAAHFDVGLEKTLPLAMLGAGTARAARILSCLLSGKEKILLIDEIENGLHHEAMEPLLKSMLELSLSRDVQIFATSHSIDVLKALRRMLGSEECAEMRAEAACHVLVRSREGGVDSYCYDYPQLDHCVGSGLEIR